ncbi:MAG: class A beta-lactamase [Gammaproteobacteria bacterium]|nr:MAG: class A beta-lactamase [Gammaproteobacteria bacterium]UTW43524.1 class A beta-lactamase [bacterium SCSIO 12844]
MIRTSIKKLFKFQIFLFLTLVVFKPTIAIASTTKLINEQLTTLSNKYGGQLGIYAINTENNDTVSYNSNHNFPMCSTIKVMGVGAILKKSINDPLLLKQTIVYNSEIVNKSGYSPITRKHVGKGMTVKSLCAAAISYTDNTAINLLMESLGGPESVTKFAKSIGDNKFNLVRWEPQLNTAIPGDLRDTTTPEAMSISLKKLILGKTLPSYQADLLTKWLVNNTTGDARIRAGIPNNWTVGDKTGTCGNYGTTNDIAVIWPTNCKPIFLSIYYTQSKKDAVPNNKIIKEATMSIINFLASNDKCLSSNLKHYPL